MEKNRKIEGFDLNGYGALYIFQSREDMENIIAANSDFVALIGAGGDHDSYFPGVYVAAQKYSSGKAISKAQTDQYPVFPPLTNSSEHEKE